MSAIESPASPVGSSFALSGRMVLSRKGSEKNGWFSCTRAVLGANDCTLDKVHNFFYKTVHLLAAIFLGSWGENLFAHKYGQTYAWNDITLLLKEGVSLQPLKEGPSQDSFQSNPYNISTRISKESERTRVEESVKTVVTQAQQMAQNGMHILEAVVAAMAEVEPRYKSIVMSEASKTLFKKPEEKQFRIAAATTIQRVVRGYLARKTRRGQAIKAQAKADVEAVMAREGAATTIQRALRGYLARKTRKEQAIAQAEADVEAVMAREAKKSQEYFFWKVLRYFRFIN